ncbi:MAG: GNAT family N-acetyltransferase [Corynebacterium sp.]|uniref:GNAT family N-acetyltransferase n=1 Tax=Corynebacterium sp. TaxID=1720 RepID=UPI0026DB3FFE|nr:GNAT family N-acetyltransferase [Corynebacterium sp.]MDO5097439.1 GNAT family N-acetyltransferase [Corynebacterium sp.]
MNVFFAVDQLSRLSALEVHKIYKLRVDVFVHEQKSPYQEIDEVDALDTTFHVQAWKHADLVERDLIACARLYPEVSPSGDKRFHLGRVCVAQPYRDRGLGTEIMKQTLRLAAEQNPEFDVYIESQTTGVPFYEALGFTVSGAEFDWDGVPHLPMVLPAAKVAAFATLD